MTTVTDILGTSAPDPHIPDGLGVKTPEQKDLYTASLEFERFFVSYMLKQMDGATKAIGGREESDPAAATGDPASSIHQDMIRDQMTQSVLDGGGLGIASVLYQQLADRLGTSTSGATAPAGSTTSSQPASSANSVGSRGGVTS